MRSARAIGVVLVVLAAFVLAGPLAAQENAPVDNCSTCHGGLPGPLGAPVAAFANDVHAAQGFGCVACHGGDATAEGLAGMDPAVGFIGAPDASNILQVCGRCHSDAQVMRRYNPSIRVDQVQEYLTSVHGERLSQVRDTSVATCSSCHPAHNIRPPSDPLSSVHPLNVASTCGACHADAAHMEEYQIPTTQLADYQTSVHYLAMTEGGDLSAPTCNDCHGNHGAAPPGVSWVGNVCGQCHSTMADYFADSRHAQIFTMLGAPGCAACHSNHAIQPASDEMLGIGEGTVCSRCHVQPVGGGAAAQVMRTLIDSLRTDYEAAEALLHEAEEAGMEVSNALFELGNANNALVQARALIHAFNVEEVETEVAEGLEVTAAAFVSGQEALSDLRFRRLGLVVSTIIIVGLITGLVFKIRQIEGKA